MILSQMKSCCSWGEDVLDELIHQSRIRADEATSKLAPAWCSVRMMAGSGIRFHGVISLDLGQMRFEVGAVAADDVGSITTTGVPCCLARAWSCFAVMAVKLLPGL